MPSKKRKNKEREREIRPQAWVGQLSYRTQFPRNPFGDWPPHTQAKQGHSLPPVAGHQVRQRPRAPQQRRHKGRDVVGGRVLAGAQLRLLLPAAHLVAVAVPPAWRGKCGGSKEVSVGDRCENGSSQITEAAKDLHMYWLASLGVPPAGLRLLT